MLPNRIAAAPSAERSCAAAPVSPGMTSNQSRTVMKNEPFTTSAERTALAAGWAPACAGGSHRCRGKSAVLASSPTVIRAPATQVAGLATIRADRSAMSSVP